MWFFCKFPKFRSSGQVTCSPSSGFSQTELLSYTTDLTAQTARALPPPTLYYYTMYVLHSPTTVGTVVPILINMLFKAYIST